MRQLILAAASIAALTLIGPASAQSPIVIKFSHVVASDTPKGKAAEKFKELAEKYSGGKVKVEIYPNSTLYKDKEELEALQLGAVQMLAPSNSKFGPIGIREFEVFDLPYILPDLKTLRKVTDGPLGARLLKLLDSKGMTGLAYWDNGFKEMSANKKLVSPDDYKGMKFRIQSSKVLEAQFRALGSIPQVMAFGEVYQALQTGVVDGQENTWSNIYTQKMHEVQKYRLRRGREQEILGRPAGGYPRELREGDEGSHRVRQQPVGQGKRRRAGNDQEGRQDRNHHPDAGAGRGDAQGDDAGLQGRGLARRSALDRRIPQRDGPRPDELSAFARGRGRLRAAEKCMVGRFEEPPDCHRGH
jgi:tripartite ATP-independent transporter DctP family solute receptor